MPQEQTLLTLHGSRAETRLSRKEVLGFQTICVVETPSRSLHTHTQNHHQHTPPPPPTPAPADVGGWHPLSPLLTQRIRSDHSGTSFIWALKPFSHSWLEMKHPWGGCPSSCACWGDQPGPLRPKASLSAFKVQRRLPLGRQTVGSGGGQGCSKAPLL